MKTKTFDDDCKFRYDEHRTGETKRGGGEHTIQDRCGLSRMKHPCIFKDKTHITCPLSTHKKPRNKNNKTKRRFKGGFS